MQSSFELTPKQAEYIRNAHHRWNVACGAVRSGKSYCQVSYCIPARLMERKGLRGLRVILGATRANIERNVLQPMRDIYGDGIATGINSQNISRIMGEKVYCIGADNVRQVAKIRGSEIAYVAIDEAIDINKEVFEMLKSRLSLPWSCCDITTNPASPNHWFKEFLDSADRGVDIYLQEYTIYDNPYLPEGYVRSLEAEYAGTVYFLRYILGKWARAEGLIFPMFLEALAEVPNGEAEDLALSVDYGTQNPFAAIAWKKKGGIWYAEREYYHSGRKTGKQKTDDEYASDLEDFMADEIEDYRIRLEASRRELGAPMPSKIQLIIDPSAASFIALMKKKDWCKVVKANNDVGDGIRETASAMKRGLIKISTYMPEWRREVEGYVWDERVEEDKPVKENDHLMDATRYFVKTKKICKIRRSYDHLSGF